MNNEEKIKNLYSDLRTKVFEALGAASMCWVKDNNHLENVFDSTTATNIGNDLINDIDLIITQMNQIYSESIFSIKLSALELIQEEHKTWTKRNFPTAEAVDYILGATEEVGELAHSFLKRKQAIRVNQDHTANIKDAVADIIIFLIGFCNKEEIDIEETLKKTWIEVRSRDWTKNKINGVTDSDNVKIFQTRIPEDELKQTERTFEQLDLFIDEKTLSLE